MQLVDGNKEAVCLVLSKSSRSQLKGYIERQWDTQHVKMDAKVFSGIGN